MHKIIHHLRKQSEEARRHILHIVIVCLGIILISLWIYSLGTKLSNENTKYEIKESIKPLQEFSEDLGGDINNI